MTHPSIYRTAGFCWHPLLAMPSEINRLRPHCYTWFRAPLHCCNRTRWVSKRQTDRDKNLRRYIHYIPPLSADVCIFRFQFASRKLPLHFVSVDVFFQSKLSPPLWIEPLMGRALSHDWTYLCKVFRKFPPEKPVRKAAAARIPKEEIFLPVCEVLAMATGIYWNWERYKN